MRHTSASGGVTAGLLREACARVVGSSDPDGVRLSAVWTTALCSQILPSLAPLTPASPDVADGDDPPDSERNRGAPGSVSVRR